MSDPHKIGKLKRLLVEKLITALETMDADAKGFSGVCTAALATVKTFHAETDETVTQQSTHISGLLQKYQERNHSTKSN